MELNMQTLMKQLLEAGVHFGHQRNKWNPKMKDYIFTEKSGIYIIDLQKTVDALVKACNFLHDVAAQGKKILFVATKKQARDIVKEAAEKCGMFYVVNRWLGGLLTNFKTVRKSVARYDKIETMKADGSFEELSKKERSQLNKELVKLKKNLDGIREMKHLPSVLFVIDPNRELIAVKEAAKLNVAIVALVDTNCNPDIIDYVIPGNDDAIRSIRLIVDIVTGRIMEGNNKFAVGKKVETEKEAEKAADVSADAAKVEVAVDELVKDAEVIEKQFRRGKKEEKIEKEQKIRHKPARKKE